MSFFDLTAPIYDLLFHPDLGELCQQGGFPSDGFIVDIGGGTGRMAHAMQNGTRKIIIVDVSYKMLLETKKRGQIFPVQADGTALPFSSATIAGVLIADAFHHFQQRQDVIQEVRRSLLSRGILYIFEPNIKKCAVKIIATLEKILGMRSKFFTIQEIEELVCAMGFRTIETQEDGSSIRLCFQKEN